MAARSVIGIIDNMMTKTSVVKTMYLFICNHHTPYVRRLGSPKGFFSQTVGHHIEIFLPLLLFLILTGVR
jgi:hypothetical protein